MPEYSPHDPRDGLDLERHPHRALHILPQIGRIPQGFSAMLPCSLLGIHRKPRRRPGVQLGQWSGLPGPDESDHPCGDETAGGSNRAG